MSSHAWFRDLLFSAQIEFDTVKHEHYGTSDVHKVAHEAGKRGDQIERIGRLGGVVAPIINQGDIAGLRRGLPELAGKIPSRAPVPAPRGRRPTLCGRQNGRARRGDRLRHQRRSRSARAAFRHFAAYGVHNDARRIAERRGEIDRQTNGVAYDDAVRDYRWHRFEPSGPGGYDDQERDIWQAIAQYKAGFNPATPTASCQ